MIEHKNELLKFNYLNFQVKKILKKNYALNIYHLKILKFINDNQKRKKFTALDFKEVLRINQTMLTHVISYLHDLNYYKKERLKQDERKIITIVETRHKMKISQLINQIELDFKSNLNDISTHVNSNYCIDYAIEVNSMISEIHHNIHHQYRINVDQFMILLFIQMSQNGCRTLKDIKQQFGWDLVKINKSIKALVQLNYLDKDRADTDERIVLVSIKPYKEKMIKLMIENVLKAQNIKNGAQNLAMVE